MLSASAVCISSHTCLAQSFQATASEVFQESKDGEVFFFFRFLLSLWAHMLLWTGVSGVQGVSIDATF